MAKRSFGENLQRLINDPVGEIKRTMGSAQKTESPTLPDRVASEVPSAPVVPSPERSVPGPQEVEGWAQGDSPEDQPWAGYPTMRENAGEVDDRPEHVKNIERQELWKQDQAAAAEADIQRSKDEQRLLDDLAAVDARRKAGSARKIARRVATPASFSEQRRDQEERAAQEAAEYQRNQLEDNVRQIESQIAQAQMRLSGIERRIAGGETATGPESLQNSRDAEKALINSLNGKLTEAQQAVEQLRETG